MRRLIFGFVAFACSLGAWAADVILEGCEKLTFDKKDRKSVV